jgi:hypothetical protein
VKWRAQSIEVRVAHLETVARANGLHDADCSALRRYKEQRHTGAYLIPPDCDCWLAEDEP